MSSPNKYKVIIPYSESGRKTRKYKIEYTVSATSRSEALSKAEDEFNSYTDYNSASWVRTIDRSAIRIWKLSSNLPQKPTEIDELASNFSDENEDVLYRCLQTAAELEDSILSSQVIGLLKHPNNDLVAMAIETLGKIGDPSNYSVVTTFYDMKYDSVIRACAVKATGKLANAADEALGLLSIALRDDDSRVRANAVEAIEMLKIADTARLLLPFLNDENNRVKANIIQALWDKHDQSALLKTLKEMSIDKSHWMRLSAIFVLDKLKIPGKVEILASMSSDEHPQVAAKAREAIFNSNGLECIYYWTALINSKSEFELVCDKLCQLGEPAVTSLLAIQSEDKNIQNNISDLLDRLETTLFNQSGWISWLRTKQKRLFNK